MGGIHCEWGGEGERRSGGVPGRVSFRLPSRPASSMYSFAAEKERATWEGNQEGKERSERESPYSREKNTSGPQHTTALKRKGEKNQVLKEDSARVVVSKEAGGGKQPWTSSLEPSSVVLTKKKKTCTNLKCHLTGEETNIRRDHSWRGGIHKRGKFEEWHFKAHRSLDGSTTLESRRRRKGKKELCEGEDLSKSRDRS